MSISGTHAAAPVDPGVALADELGRLRRLRIRQICLLLGAGLLASLLASVYDRDWTTAAALAAGLAVVSGSAVLNARGATAAAAIVLLCSLTLLATAVMALNQGPYSPAVMIFPFVLIVCSMTVGTRAFVALLVVMLAVLAVMTWASASGTVDFSMSRYGPIHGIYTGIALLASGVAVQLLGGDLRRAVRRLRTEMDALTRSQARLDHLARHDALTNLPNRAQGRERLQALLAEVGREQRAAALLFVDIDNFTTINDTLGHAAGDALLVAFGERLKRCTPAATEIVRQGADQFLLLLPPLDAAAQAGDAAARVLRAMAEPFSSSGGAPLAVTCSIGIAVFPGDGADADALLKKATVAARHAKEAGRNAFRFFDTAMNAGMLEDLNINTELKLALQRGQLQLHYQPLTRLADGALVGCEALLRWEHPTRGTIAPDVFIPVAERSGLIVDIGDWVIDHACRQIAAWRGGPLDGLVVAVNTSALQFKRGTIASVVAQALQRHGAPPSRLEVEVTESALIHDADAFVAVLSRLKSLGVHLAIDDFGTGYSNLAYLQRFDVDKLKIDRSFVRRLHQSGADRAIVQAIVQMAHSLDLQTTAEGIEDEPTHDALRAIGCDLGQGWLFGRPMPVAAFERWCAERLAHHAATH